MLKQFLLAALCLVYFAVPAAFAVDGREGGPAAPAPAEIPETGRPLRVFGATFPSTFAIYALSPDLLAGWNAPIRGYEARYIPQKYQALPVLGGWYGQGFFPDREKLLEWKIDMVLYLTGDRTMGVNIEEQVKDIGLPLTVIQVLFMRDYAPMFREMGEKFGLPGRGEALAAYAEKALADIRAMLGDIPAEKRPRVYVSQDVDGLGTVCDTAIRSEMVNLAGGVNVHNCPEALKESAMKVPFEQILLYDPDVLLILHHNFMERFASEAKWQNLRAVCEGRVYFVPHEPFNWMDKPATYMRLIGVQWLACRLHPDRCGKDMVRETGEFMKLFFNLDLDDAEINAILKQ